MKRKLTALFFLALCLVTSGCLKQMPDEYRQVERGFLGLLEEYGYRRDGIVFTCRENVDRTIAIFCHFGLGMLLVSILSGISPVLLWQSLFLPWSAPRTNQELGS